MRVLFEKASGKRTQDECVDTINKHVTMSVIQMTTHQVEERVKARMEVESWSGCNSSKRNVSQKGKGAFIRRRIMLPLNRLMPQRVNFGGAKNRREDEIPLTNKKMSRPRCRMVRPRSDQ